MVLPATLTIIAANTAPWLLWNAHTTVNMVLVTALVALSHSFMEDSAAAVARRIRKQREARR